MVTVFVCIGGLLTRVTTIIILSHKVLNQVLLRMFQTESMYGGAINRKGDGK